MEKQRRNTTQRRLVLEAVRNRLDHPCADDIYLDVIKKDPHISRGTVYRNLNLLSDSGEIRHVRLPQGTDRFDLRLDNHYHVLCLGCGKLSDIDMPYHAELDKQTAEQSGYSVGCHRTVFEGLCPDCAGHRG